MINENLFNTMDMPEEDLKKQSLFETFKVKHSSMTSKTEWKKTDDSVVKPKIVGTVLNTKSNSDTRSQRDIVGVAHIDGGIITIASTNVISKRIGPIVPPKPFKKNQDSAKVPKSCIVDSICEPDFSKRLQSLSTFTGSISSDAKSEISDLQRKHASYALYKPSSNNVTLDNPALLEQQLEALSHHKSQLEKNGAVFPSRICYEKNVTVISNLSSDSSKQEDSACNVIYTNTLVSSLAGSATSTDKNQPSELNMEKDIKMHTNPTSYTGVKRHRGLIYQLDKIFPVQNEIYSNFIFGDTNQATSEYSNHHDEEALPPPSPVSSSYSELRRATDVFKKPYSKINETSIKSLDGGGCAGGQPHLNMICRNELNTYCPSLQASSTYESIYEPIIPRPASQLSGHGNYLNYVPYVNGSQLNKNASGGNLSTIGSNSIGCNTPSYPSIDDNIFNLNSNNSIQQKEVVVNALNDFLVQSLDSGNGVESYGTCFKCNERVLGENSGCTAMDQIYHISCFTCKKCKINLQGKPFYALDGKPFCEYDYLQTLEKCSVCLEPILERILRATGKPYHPHCFTCIICGKSLDGIPFTVDATNQNYCIADFHKIFAPRCCVCMEPIMPKPGEEETVRVVALDRSFHFECYKCEDCGLLLSSEAEGRGCYPLDGHVLCKSCNAKRVQTLTSRMAIEL